MQDQNNSFFNAVIEFKMNVFLFILGYFDIPETLIGHIKMKIKNYVRI